MFMELLVMKVFYLIFPFLLFISLFIPISSTNADAIKVVIYGDDAYEPYSYAKNSNHTQQLFGIYPQILRKIFEKMPQYDVEIRPMPWNRALKALEDEQVFAIFPPYYRPFERTYIGDYSGPILQEKIVIYGPKTHKLNPILKKFPENWRGKHLAMFLGTQDIAGLKFQELVKENAIKVSEEKGNDKNLILVGLNKRDGYINDRLAIQYTLNKLITQNQWPKEAEVPVEILEIAREDGHVAFAKNSKNQFPYSTDFIKRFNQALNELKKQGEIDKILKNYTSGKLLH